jgi:hypothetical protein
MSDDFEAVKRALEEAHDLLIPARRNAECAWTDGTQPRALAALERIRLAYDRLLVDKTPALRLQLETKHAELIAVLDGLAALKQEHERIRAEHEALRRDYEHQSQALAALVKPLSPRGDFAAALARARNRHARDLAVARAVLEAAVREAEFNWCCCATEEQLQGPLERRCTGCRVGDSLRALDLERVLAGVGDGE